MKTVQRMVERYLLLWLLIVSVFAFYESALGIYFFRGAGAYLKLLIVVTMFAVGWMLPRDELRQVLSRWPTVLGGTAIQYTVMPCLAFLMAWMLQLEGGLKIGIVMVGCVPGAMASNVLTLTARGNTSYSVSLTTMATLVSPLVVPLVMAVTLQQDVSNEKLIKAAIELSWMVVLPVALGHLMARFIPESQEAATTIGSIVANLAILWIVAYVVAANRNLLLQIHFTVLLGLLAINALGYLAGNGGGRLMGLPTGMRRALTLEIGMQNAGLGTALVTSLFPDDRGVEIPSAFYTFGCMLTGTILAQLWSLRGPDMTKHT